MPLLYVDLLGMKARYRSGGVRSARRGYRIFGEILAEALNELPSDRPVSGGIQSDAAALQFATAVDAVIVGRAVFRETLMWSTRNRRLWIRGVIMRGGYPGVELQSEQQLEGAPAGIFERHFNETLLRAINAEQSGFRGQRLLIEDQLVTPHLAATLQVPVGQGAILPAHRLRYSNAPDGFHDVLWPMPEDASQWPIFYRRLIDRLRWASDGGDFESLQASATHLLFAEIDSIVHALGGEAAGVL